MDLKSFIKARRLEIGKTLEDVAKEVGVTKATVLRWETGEIANMRRDKISLLAKSLKIAPAALMGWEDPTPKTEKLSPIRQEFLDKVDGMTEEQLKKLNDLLDAFLLQKKQ